MRNYDLALFMEFVKTSPIKQSHESQFPCQSSWPSKKMKYKNFLLYNDLNSTQSK